MTELGILVSISLSLTLRVSICSPPRPCSGFPHEQGRAVQRPASTSSCGIRRTCCCCGSGLNSRRTHADLYFQSSPSRRRPPAPGSLLEPSLCWRRREVSSGSDPHIDPGGLYSAVTLVSGDRAGDGPPACLLRQSDEFLEHQVPGRPRQLVDVGGGQAGRGDGVED